MDGAPWQFVRGEVARCEVKLSSSGIDASSFGGVLYG